MHLGAERCERQRLYPRDFGGSPSTSTTGLIIHVKEESLRSHGGGCLVGESGRPRFLGFALLVI